MDNTVTDVRDQWISKFCTKWDEQIDIFRTTKTKQIDIVRTTNKYRIDSLSRKRDDDIVDIHNQFDEHVSEVNTELTTAIGHINTQFDLDVKSFVTGNLNETNIFDKICSYIHNAKSIFYLQSYPLTYIPIEPEFLLVDTDTRKKCQITLVD
jgi:hypothetical protein